MITIIVMATITATITVTTTAIFTVKKYIKYNIEEKERH